MQPAGPPQCLPRFPAHAMVTVVTRGSGNAVLKRVDMYNQNRSGVFDVHKTKRPRQWEMCKVCVYTWYSEKVLSRLFLILMAECMSFMAGPHEGALARWDKAASLAEFCSMRVLWNCLSCCNVFGTPCVGEELYLLEEVCTSWR